MIGMRLELRHEHMVTCCVCGKEEALEAVRPVLLGKLWIGSETEKGYLSDPDRSWLRVNVRTRDGCISVFYTCDDGCRAKFWSPCVDGSGAPVYAPGESMTGHAKLGMLERFHASAHARRISKIVSRELADYYCDDEEFDGALQLVCDMVDPEGS